MGSQESMTGIAGLTAAAAPATNPLPPLNQAPRQGQILPKCYNGSADCGLLIMNLLQRAVAKARHPFDRWERFYVFPDQWGMTKPQEQHRFEECNKIIESLGTFAVVLRMRRSCCRRPRTSLLARRRPTSPAPRRPHHRSPRTGIAKKNWRRRPHYRSAAAPPRRLTRVGLIIQRGARRRHAKG